jgi:hypothetical protein
MKRFWIVLGDEELRDMRRFETAEEASKFASDKAEGKLQNYWVFETETCWTRVLEQAKQEYLYR